MEGMAASLTGYLDGGERQRRGRRGVTQRRRPCAVREEAGLGVESSEGREEMLPAQGIEK